MSEVPIVVVRAPSRGSKIYLNRLKTIKVDSRRTLLEPQSLVWLSINFMNVFYLIFIYLCIYFDIVSQNNILVCTPLLGVKGGVPGEI